MLRKLHGHDMSEPLISMEQINCEINMCVKSSLIFLSGWESVKPNPGSIEPMWPFRWLQALYSQHFEMSPDCLGWKKKWIFACSAFLWTVLLSLTSSLLIREQNVLAQCRQLPARFFLGKRCYMGESLCFGTQQVFIINSINCRTLSCTPTQMISAPGQMSLSAAHYRPVHSTLGFY